MMTGWSGWQGRFIVRELPLAEGINPSSTTEEKGDALYLKKYKASCSTSFYGPRACTLA